MAAELHSNKKSDNKKTFPLSSWNEEDVMDYDKNQTGGLHNYPTEKDNKALHPIRYAEKKKKQQYWFTQISVM